MTARYKISDSTFPISIFSTSSINATSTYTVNKTKVYYTDFSQLYQSNAFSYTVGTTTPDYKNGSFKITVSGNNGNSFLVYAMDCILYAPIESTSGWGDATWSDNPTVQYTYSSWSIYGEDNYVGPSITNSFDGVDVSGVKYKYTTPSVFYIQPGVPNTLDSDKYSVPVYSFIGSPIFSSANCTGGCANQSSALIGRLNYDYTTNMNWILYYQMNPSSNTCSYNPINGNMGFPFYYSSATNSSFLYFEVIFALPMYGGEFLTNKLINSKGLNGSAPTAPGYLMAFYKRSIPACNTSPYEPYTTDPPETILQYSNYTKSTDPDAIPVGNFFPVIYESGNFANQNTGKLPYNCSLLYLLNYIGSAGTLYDTDSKIYSTVHDALVGLGWLENVGTGTGVNFGKVKTVNSGSVNLGSGWYFAGYVPHNFAYQSTSQKWSSSVKEVPTLLSQNVSSFPTTFGGKSVVQTSTSTYGTTTGTTSFMGNNVVMATTVPTDSIGNVVSYYAGDKVGTPVGNYFWQSMTTNCVPLSVMYTPGRPFAINVSIVKDCVFAYTQQNSVPYIQVQIGNDDKSDKSIIVTKYFQPNVGSSKVFYDTVVFNVNFNYPNDFAHCDNGGCTLENDRNKCNNIYLYNYSNANIYIIVDSYHKASKYVNSDSCTVTPGNSAVFSSSNTAANGVGARYYRQACA